ncbi:MAG TPA: hypothetical protein VLK82_16550 [Candidatus Tectomicrobia bacterium]|nr:hypothetical protein [Candidatus Tectomicrobia bacterium]
MLRTIRLTLADVHEPDTLLTVNDKRGWPSDVKAGEAKPMIDPITLDHRAVWIDQDRKGETAGAMVIGHFFGLLAGDRQYLSS